jgi:hypothetical protein
VVLFDPATIIDRSTYDDPHQYPAGIGTVIANGTVVTTAASTRALCRAGCSGGGERCWREAELPDAAVAGVSKASSKRGRRGLADVAVVVDKVGAFGPVDVANAHPLRDHPRQAPRHNAGLHKRKDRPAAHSAEIIDI